jgi:hypothetical protein
MTFLATSSVINVSLADTSYTSQSGKVIYNSGLYYDTLTNHAGCDSVIAINLLVRRTKIFVDIAASGTETGVNWANAYTDLQDALDDNMLAGADTILIAEGTYYPSQSPDETTTNVKKRAFHLADSNVIILGGFDPNTGTQTGDTTFLSGDIGAVLNNNQKARHVLITKGLSAATSIEDIVITSGSAKGNGTL